MPEQLQNPFVLWLALTAVLAALAYAFVRLELRTRAILYGAFILACGVAFWPPYETTNEKGEKVPGRIRLGLDLRGGIHLVLRVKTDDAIAATTNDSVQLARTVLGEKGVTYSGAQGKDLRSFAVEGVEPARVKDARELLEDQFRAPDWEVREASAASFSVEMTDKYVKDLRDRTVKEAILTLERRVNELGVAEPVIAQHGSQGDQILVQLPGVKDPQQAKKVIQTTAQLSLKIVEDTASTKETLLEARGGKIPDNLDLLQGQGSEPLKPEGATKFGRLTGANIGRQLAIVLDNQVVSAPSIEGKISAEGRITGRFSREEADTLAKVLRAGALPASLEYLHELSVGPSLGKDSIRSGVMAATAGMSFLAIFMVLYYRLSGVNAIVALVANLVILLGAMAYMGATLTLPGIAGIILTVGVGVDTNVLVFERIREEIRNGKPVRNAINNGFERVWITILDTHATALIAAAFLFQFGTGPIKGFAVTLVWGLVANVFASYFVSKFLFEWVLGKRQVASLSI
jgi:preprotein translocase subunit SecD